MAGVRPDGSKSAISELWLDGELVSRAELTRSRMNNSAEKDLKQAVKERSQAGFDAGHWYWQPVGGRSANPMPKKDGPDMQAMGALRSLENRSNVDLVVFGREQDDFDGEFDDTQVGFEASLEDFLGNKKRVGKLDINNSRVDSIVFGVDLDGYDQTPEEQEAELRAMPEFRGAAGLCSVQTKDNKPASKVDQPEPPPATMFGRLRNSSDVDEVVFNHDMGDGGNAYEEWKSDPMWKNVSGVHSADINHDAFVANRAMKKRSEYTGSVSSTDLTFAKPQSVTDLQQMPAFHNAAGRSTREEQLARHEGAAEAYAADGRRTISQAFAPELARPGAPAPTAPGQHVNIAPPGHPLNLAHIPREPQEPSTGQFFTEPQAAQRRARAPPYEGCAGLSSEGVFYATNNSITRKLLPSGWAAPAPPEPVLPPPERQPRWQTEPQKFDGCAGVNSETLHKRAKGKMVPQLRDTADDIILNRDMDHPQQKRNEEAFKEMQRGAAGQPTREADQAFLDARLYKSGEANARPVRPSYPEPPNQLQGTLVRTEEEVSAEVPSAFFADARGTSRAQLAKNGRQGAEGAVFVSYDGHRRYERTRNDLRSADMAAALNPALPDPGAAPLAAPHERLGDAAGKSMRAANDADDRSLVPDHDTEIEARLAEMHNGGHRVAELLSGELYYARGEPPRPRPVDDVRELAKRDSVGADNLLKQEVHIKSGQLRLPGEPRMHEEQLRHFARPNPNAEAVGAEAERIAQARFRTAAGTQQLAVAQEAQRLVAGSQGPQKLRVRHPWLDAPEECVALEERKFIPAAQRSQTEGTGRQVDVAGPRHVALGRSPFGVDADRPTQYTTAAKEAWSPAAAGLNSPTSMAGRIAQRRLQRADSPRSSPGGAGGRGGGGGALVAVGQRR